MHLILPDKDYDAFIYDCDGTLVDSMPAHYRAWCQALERAGATFPFPESQFYGFAGVQEQEIVRRLNAQHDADVDPDAVAHLKDILVRQLASEVAPIAEVADHARLHHGQRPLAVASGSPESLVRLFLEQARLLHLFETIITPADVARGKPSPDMFLLAALRMGVSPHRCLVFEDGASGLSAARSAQMDAVFVPSAPGSRADEPPEFLH